MTLHMGPNARGQAHPTAQAGLPPDLEAVALVDADTAAATGCMAPSWWRKQVAAGKAPQPVCRTLRCTRWRKSDVVEFWRQFAENGKFDPEVMDRSRRANAAAQAMRDAERASGGITQQVGQ